MGHRWYATRYHLRLDANDLSAGAQNNVVPGIDLLDAHLLRNGAVAIVNVHRRAAQLWRWTKIEALAAKTADDKRRVDEDWCPSPGLGHKCRPTQRQTQQYQTDSRQVS